MASPFAPVTPPITKYCSGLPGLPKYVAPLVGGTAVVNGSLASTLPETVTLKLSTANENADAAGVEPPTTCQLTELPSASAATRCPMAACGWPAVTAADAAPVITGA